MRAHSASDYHREAQEPKGRLVQIPVIHSPMPKCHILGQNCFSQQQSLLWNDATHTLADKRSLPTSLMAEQCLTLSENGHYIRSERIFEVVLQVWKGNYCVCSTFWNCFQRYCRSRARWEMNILDDPGQYCAIYCLSWGSFATRFPRKIRSSTRNLTIKSVSHDTFLINIIT